MYVYTRCRWMLIICVRLRSVCNLYHAWFDPCAQLMMMRMMMNMMRHVPLLSSLLFPQVFGRGVCVEVRTTSRTRLEARDGCVSRSLIGRIGQDRPSSFTLGGESLRAQRNVCGWQVYMDFYMVEYGWCFVVCRNLRRSTSKRYAWCKFRWTVWESRALDNWHRLWVRVNIPHNCMVMALGSCVKWPYCGHFQLHRRYWPLDWIRIFLILLMVVLMVYACVLLFQFYEIVGVEMYKRYERSNCKYLFL